MRTNRNSAYYRNLIQRVIKNSVSDIWDNAVLEWEVFDCEEDETLEASCIVAKKNSVTYSRLVTNAMGICCIR